MFTNLFGNEHRKIYGDLSLYFLLLSNVFVIIGFLRGNISSMQVVLIYLSQSIIIGFFNVLKILTYPVYQDPVLKQGVSREKFEALSKMKSTKFEEVPLSTRLLNALFFAFHFGFFHLVYIQFIIFNSFFTMLLSGQSLDFRGIGIIIFNLLIYSLVFFINHLFSFFYNKSIDKEKKRTYSISSLMTRPYLRIIPMHIFIMLGAWIGSSAFIVFIILKTIVDIAMHVNEHK